MCATDTGNSKVVRDSCASVARMWKLASAEGPEGGLRSCKCPACTHAGTAALAEAHILVSPPTDIQQEGGVTLSFTNSVIRTRHGSEPVLRFGLH